LDRDTSTRRNAWFFLEALEKHRINALRNFQITCTGRAFSPVSLPSIQTAAGEDILQRLTPLAAWQQDILQRLGLDPFLSQQLEMHDTGN
jgi:hypothetical protein